MGTHVYWTLPGRGPAKEYAPEREERVERLQVALAQRGALTAEGAAAHNHSSLPQARDLNAVVLMGKAVRVKVNLGQKMVWVSLPLPETLAGVDWGKEALAQARQESRHEGRDELLAAWRWEELVTALPATAVEAAQWAWAARI